MKTTWIDVNLNAAYSNALQAKQAAGSDNGLDLQASTQNFKAKMTKALPKLAGSCNGQCGGW